MNQIQAQALLPGHAISTLITRGRELINLVGREKRNVCDLFIQTFHLPTPSLEESINFGTFSETFHPKIDLQSNSNDLQASQWKTLKRVDPGQKFDL